VRVNDSSDKIGVGSFLLGITFALEFEVGPTLGLMQSYEYSFGKRLFPTRMIRSSLALGPGEVGAPVFDLNGRFVGITHAALPDLQSSFLLPAKACKRIRDDLLLSGQVDYGWFGITTTRKLNQENSFDIVINGFVDDSPAKDSKLKVGDILHTVGGVSIKTQGDLANASFFAEPDTILEFKVKRDGKNLMIPLKVTIRPQNQKLSTPSINLNLDESNSSSVADLNSTETVIPPNF
jgi:S1-C subfamily serine protease